MLSQKLSNLAHFVPLHFYLVVVVCGVYLTGIGKTQSGKHYDNDLLGWPSAKEVQRRLPYSLLGYAKDGKPVWYLHLGKWDLHEMVETEKGFKASADHFRNAMENFCDTKTWSLPGNPQDKYYSIYNMEGYGLKQLLHFSTAQYFMEAAKIGSEVILQNNNCMDRAIIINANSPYRSTYSMIKPLLGEVAERIDLYGTDPEEWKRVLLNFIDKDQLPLSLGGSSKHKYVTKIG